MILFGYLPVWISACECWCALPLRRDFAVEDGDVGLRCLSNLGALKNPKMAATAICTYSNNKKFKWFLLWQCLKETIWAQNVSVSSEEWGLHPPLPVAVLRSESRPVSRREPSRREEGSVILWGAVMASAPPSPPRKEEGGIPTIPCQGQSTYTPPANQGCSWRLYFSIWTSVTFFKPSFVLRITVNLDPNHCLSRISKISIVNKSQVPDAFYSVLRAAWLLILHVQREMEL